MIGHAAWEQRREQWRDFYEWETADPPPAADIADVIPSKDSTPNWPSEKRAMRLDALCSLDDLDPDNESYDLLPHLDDGRVYNNAVATPRHIYRCVDNDGIDYFLGQPPLLSVGSHPRMWSVR